MLGIYEGRQIDTLLIAQLMGIKLDVVNTLLTLFACSSLILVLMGLYLSTRHVALTYP